MNEYEPSKDDDKVKLDDSPAGLHRRWMLELGAAKDALETFHDEGDKVVEEFRGTGTKGSRLNLLFADIQTKSANLSGVPKVRARRRFADALDDVARVSATCLDRLLNSDIERESDGYRKALANAKGDWLKPGLGQVRLRYVVKTEPTETPDPDTGESIAGERKTFEDVETDYVKWRRFLWTPAEVWDDVRAVFYGLELSQEEWDRQFPGQVFRPTHQKKAKDELKRAFGRAEVWEIWDKDTKQVHFLSEVHEEMLKTVPDPLGLPGFFPSPEPLAANVTTSKYVPRATYYLAKDQYDEAHELQKRIRALIKQVKVCGGYDSNSEALQNILTDAADGKLYPVKNFATLVGKDGLANAISLLPIAPQVEAIIALSERLALVKREIYEITGQSDIMRGQAAEKATATEQRIKARFGSSRIQSEQDEFARFASDAQRIRSFIIAKHFDAQTIIQRSNIAESEKIDAPDGSQQPNMELIGKAVEMLKSDIGAYRIDVDADSLAMTDFDAVQQESMALLKGTAEYFGAVAPLSTSPDLAGFFAEVFQQAIAGVRGADRFEPIVDRFIAKMREKAKEPPPPPPPDPKVEQEKIKTQALQMRAQLDERKGQMDMQGKVMDLQVKRAELQMKGQEMAMDLEAKQADHAMAAEEMALNREMAHEEHAMGREQMHMGMEAQRVATDEKIRAAKAKPKEGGK